MQKETLFAIVATMGVPKWHRSKSRQGQRRMHVFLKAPKLQTCPKCAKALLPHVACPNCGYYKGVQIKDVLAKLTKKERKLKEKEINKNPNDKIQNPK